ncbi:unnamed protein product, partial [Brassica rapa subsp. trilocularis]
ESKSPPAIDDLCVPMLKPPEAFSKRAFDFAFNTIHLVTRHPFLPLQLRVRYPPRLRPPNRFALLHIIHVVLRRRPVRSAIAPEASGSRTAVVRLDLHPSVGSLTAVVFH